MKIYLAASLFSQVERVYNRRLKERLEALLPSCEVVLPQDFRADKAGSYNDRRHFQSLYRQCVAALDSVDAVVAMLDGADVDSGVAFEVGYAVARGKPVVGVRTDFRQLQEKGVNIMLSQGCTEVLVRFSFDERLDALAEPLVRAVEKALAKAESPKRRRTKGKV